MKTTTLSPLFVAIQLEDWESLLSFLQSGTWQKGYCALNGPESFPPEIQVRMWATSTIGETKDKTPIKWETLPLHAAVGKSTPLKVIEALIRAYPESVCVPDNFGNLALHLAVQRKAMDLAGYLARAYPDAIQTKNLKGRLALDYLPPNDEQSLQQLLEISSGLFQKFSHKLKKEIKHEQEKYHAASKELKKAKSELFRLRKKLKVPVPTHTE